MNDNIKKWWDLYFDGKEMINPITLADDIYLKFNNKICPDKDKVFKCFELIPPEEVKVVILGQDPYHTKGQAQGLAFSLLDGEKMQPSMRNILKELKDDLGIVRTSQDLTQWSKQGILLLNTALTVKEGKPSSMLLEWRPFTEHLIRKISGLDQPIVFVLWGIKAQSYIPYINQKQIILQTSHPSPFSARKGFFGSKPFSKINRILMENDLKAINWK